MTSYALYRLPHGKQAVRIEQTDGQPEQLSTYRDLNGRSGFVFAPFDISRRCPVLIIRPDRTTVEQLPTHHHADAPNPQRHSTGDSGRRTYARDFEAFHNALEHKRFDKLVLARRTHISATEAIDAHKLFVRACELYPRMFIALVSTPVAGMWLMATPEILLAGDGRTFSTMALAGTMRLTDNQLAFDTPAQNSAEGDIVWDEKNTQEQAYVATYINDRISQFATVLNSNGPYTARAGRLVHLRTDFNFELDDSSRLGDIIDSLHPTPAVCGIPKDEARRFIVDNETDGRDYYSGFAGMLQPDGHTQLYVALRCMNIDTDGYNLYAGGGLLRESDEQHEWEETENKMDTMRCVINQD